MKKRPRGILTFTGKKGWDGETILNSRFVSNSWRRFAYLTRGFHEIVVVIVPFCANVFDIDPNRMISFT